MKKLFKRSMAMLLVALLVVAMVPFTASAEETGGTGSEPQPIVFVLENNAISVYYFDGTKQTKTTNTSINLDWTIVAATGATETAITQKILENVYIEKTIQKLTKAKTETSEAEYADSGYSWSIMQQGSDSTIANAPGATAKVQIVITDSKSNIIKINGASYLTINFADPRSYYDFTAHFTSAYTGDTSYKGETVSLNIDGSANNYYILSKATVAKTVITAATGAQLAGASLSDVYVDLGTKVVNCSGDYKFKKVDTASGDAKKVKEDTGADALYATTIDFKFNNGKTVSDKSVLRYESLTVYLPVVESTPVVGFSGTTSIEPGKTFTDKLVINETNTAEKAKYYAVIQSVTSNYGTFTYNPDTSTTVKLSDSNCKSYKFTTDMSFTYTASSTATSGTDTIKYDVYYQVGTAKDTSKDTKLTTKTASYVVKASTIKASNASKTATMGGGTISYDLASLLTGITSDDYSKITYTLSGAGSTYGTYAYGASSTSKTAMGTGTATSTLGDKRYVYYTPKTISGSSSDKLTVAFTYSGKTITNATVYLTTTTTTGAAYDQTTFKASYTSSNKYAYAAYCENTVAKTVTISETNLTNNSNVLTTEYSGKYAKLTLAPNLGTLASSGTAWTEGKAIAVSALKGLVYTRAATGIDKFEFEIYSSSDCSGTKTATLIMWVVNDSTLLNATGYDVSEFNAKSDVYTVNNSKQSSASSSKAKALTLDDFGDYVSGISSDDYDSYYIKIASADALKLGTLYYGSSKATTSDKIYLEDIEDGKLAYCRTAAGADQFKFTLYSSSKAVNSGVKMWIVEKASDIESAEATLKDISVYLSAETALSCYSDLFEDAIETKETVSYIKFTSVPKDGTLKLNASTISKDKEISYSDLKNVKYVPSSSAEAGDTDSFTWTIGNSSKNYADTEATFNIYYYTKDQAGEKNVSGDFTIYGSGKEASFDESYFELAWVTRNNNYTSASARSKPDVIIVTLPSTGTLYNGSKEVSKGDCIDYSDLDDLTYEASGSTITKTSFDFACVATEKDSYTEGTVTILSDGTTAASANWTGNSTYTASDLTSDSNGLVTFKADSDLVKEFISKAPTTLTIVVPGDTKTTARKFTIDNSFFGSSNTSKIRYLTLSEGSTGASLTLDTAAVAKVLGTSDLVVTLTVKSVSANNSIVANSISTNTIGSARIVDIKAAAVDLSLDGAADAVLKIPYTKGSSYDTTVMYQYTSSTSYSVLTSSEATSSYCSADISGSGTYFPAVNTVSFSDVSGNWAWTQGFISALSARGIIDGYTDGTYKPDAAVTRSQFIKLLIVSLGLEKTGATCSYSDMTGHWSYEYVAAAYQLGIVDSAEKFYPDSAITRKDMALYAYRAAQKANLTLPTSGTVKTFNDQSQITGEYTSAIQAMQKAGIINGMAGQYEGYFLPEGSTNRSAAAKIIWFLCKYYYGWSTSK